MRILKIVVAVVGLVVLAAGGFVTKLLVTGVPHYPTQKVEFKVEQTPEAVARGRKWAKMLCAECHGDARTKMLTGKNMEIPQFGDIHSYNITQHPTKGIGAWEPGEIAFLLRTGIARDGRYTPPWMAKLPHMSDEDLAGVIAYLRSGEPEVQAADVASIPAKPNLFSLFLMEVAFKPFAYPTQKITAPPMSDAVAYGRYLTWNLDCYTCHSADFSTMNAMEPPKSEGYLGGGNKGLTGSDGVVLVTPNITMDPETGIGKWTEAEFVKAVREGMRPDGSSVRMAAYNLLTEEEAKAIFAYIKTVPPLRNKVERAPMLVAAASASAGQKVFYKYGCTSCHGTTGSGACDLTTNKATYGSDDDLIAFIKEPNSKVPGSTMPRWGGVISEADFKSLAVYVRTLAR